jgi:hypothetical protein
MEVGDGPCGGDPEAGVQREGDGGDEERQLERGEDDRSLGASALRAPSAGNESTRGFRARPR